MKSFLLIVGVALAFAKNNCGYTVVRGPHPSECGNDQGWTTAKSDSLHYRRTRLKVFETEDQITIEQAHSLCEFHCSTVANASYLVLRYSKNG
ncbi:hypothetical protein Q1695_005352 [Nippostrongylus brasiliensis]|nr:hypothetical protein Q1695_005352 [Nippostrongylus brasiliensis]